jgi:hypothetical protein
MPSPQKLDTHHKSLKINLTCVRFRLLRPKSVPDKKRRTRSL